MAIKPDRQTLFRTEDTELIPDVPVTIYWTSENPGGGASYDDNDRHGAGGKTMATDVTYSTTVNLALTGLGAGERVEVYVVEEDANGNPFTSGVPSEIYGRAGGGPVRQSVSLTGVATQRMTVRVYNHGAQVVTLTEARAASHFWPNA